jgi:hypothetical protein
MPVGLTRCIRGCMERPLEPRGNLGLRRFTLRKARDQIRCVRKIVAHVRITLILSEDNARLIMRNRPSRAFDVKSPVLNVVCNHPGAEAGRTDGVFEGINRFPKRSQAGKSARR